MTQLTFTIHSHVKVPADSAPPPDFNAMAEGLDKWSWTGGVG